MAADRIILVFPCGVKAMMMSEMMMWYHPKVDKMAQMDKGELYWQMPSH